MVRALNDCFGIYENFDSDFDKVSRKIAVLPSTTFIDAPTYNALPPQLDNTLAKLICTAYKKNPQQQQKTMAIFLLEF